MAFDVVHIEVRIAPSVRRELPAACICVRAQVRNVYVCSMFVNGHSLKFSAMDIVRKFSALLLREMKGHCPRAAKTSAAEESLVAGVTHVPTIGVWSVVSGLSHI